jgi:hypothetical protein
MLRTAPRAWMTAGVVKLTFPLRRRNPKRGDKWHLDEGAPRSALME